MLVEENENQLIDTKPHLFVDDEEDLKALVSQSFEYSEDSDESPYFIASSYTE